MTEKEIIIKVVSGENGQPKKISWDATDSPTGKEEECSSFILSLWDGKAKDQLNIHLWTSKMSVEEMNHFYFRNMMLMADSYERATQDKLEAQKLRDHAVGFGKRTKVLKDGA